jgi:hypothetical protein
MRIILITCVIVYFLSLINCFASDTWHNIFGHREKSTHWHIIDTEPNEWVLGRIMYYEMTTLAKVGYGDFHPISDWERAFAIITLMATLFYFSSILEKLIKLFAHRYEYRHLFRPEIQL